VHVLSVSSLKGGVGKTTVSLGLASAAYAKGLRTLVVDLDTQCDASTGLGAIGDFETTVVDVLKRPVHGVVHKAILPSSWNKTQPSKIDVLVGESLASQYDSPTPTVRDLWKLEQALSTVEDDYDLVIIDTPPSLNGLTRSAWTASDRVLLVAEPAIFAVGGVKRAMLAVDEVHNQLNPRLALVGVVLNRVNSAFTEHEYRQNELAGIIASSLLSVSFSERAAVQQAQGAARPIHSWPGEAAAEISSNFDALLAAIEESMNVPHEKFKRGRAAKKRAAKNLRSARKANN
jgi:chromosome partitioning protein